MYANKAFAKSRDFEKNRSKKVAILGSGISGMTAAHELVERGFQVVVYEARSNLGGKARSIFVPGTATDTTLGLPGEHGFRIFGGFYKHAFDIMKRIPFENQTQGVFDSLHANERNTITLPNGSRFHIPLKLNFNQMNFKSLATYFEDLVSYNKVGISNYEVGIFINRLALVLQSCEERRYAEYEKITWYDFLQSSKASPLFMDIFGAGLVTLIQAIRGHEASARTIAQAFYNTFSQVFQNRKGGVYSLNAPTSVSWIQPWKEHLESLGVVFKTGHELKYLVLRDDTQIEKAVLMTEGHLIEVQADIYISALSIQGVQELIRTSGIDRKDAALKKTLDLTSKWLIGAQYFLDTDVRFPEDFLMVAQSPWAVTAVASNTFWKKDVRQYSDGTVKGLISVDISEWERPGILFGKPAQNCTPEEVRAEAWAQLLQGADPSTRTQLMNAKILNWSIDPTVHFRPQKNAYRDGLFMNIADSWKNRPNNSTQYSNLFLTGDYTQTWTDLACMEGACESGKRVTNAILAAQGDSSLVKVMRPDEPQAFLAGKLIDQMRFKAGLPQIMVKL